MEAVLGCVYGVLMMDDRTKVAITGVVIALLGAGYLITPKTHYCLTSNKTMECDRLSSTGLTCYYGNTSSRCGQAWVRLSDYVPDVPKPVDSGVIKYLCNSTSCVRVD